MKPKSKPPVSQPSQRTSPAGANKAALAEESGFDSAVQARQPSSPSFVTQAWAGFCSLLRTPVNGASLGIFRIAVGVIMALEAWILCHPSASTNGKVPLEMFYTAPEVKFHFAYPGFQWLPVLPAHALEALVGLLAFSGLIMALGLMYRLAAILVFLSWGYLYAIESTRTYWMSYHYLELLTSFLLIWMPAARRFSVDAWIAGKKRAQTPLQKNSAASPLPRLAAGTVPFWTLFLLRGQLVITYFYAGVAKLNADWLLDAQPVRYFLSHARWIHDYGAYFSPAHLAFLTRVLQSHVLAYFLSWTGALFDLGVGFLLLFRRTRIFGMVLMLIFHATNHFVIFEDIDLFPLLGVLTATIFLDADWPERFWNWLRRPRLAKPDWAWFFMGGILFPVVGAALGWKLKPGSGASSSSEPGQHERKTARTARNPAGVLGLMGAQGSAALFVVGWLAWQALMPARQWIIPGDARFTWEGLSFSWRLKADLYRCTPCNLWVEDPHFVARDPSGRCRIDWNQWRGDKVIYRTLSPGRVDWAQLPELIVLLEPMLGQRILYNPYSGNPAGWSEAESRTRVQGLWLELYGHAPQVVLRTASPTDTLSACAATLRARGYSVKTTLETEQKLDEMLAQGEERELTSIMRQTHPLALHGGSIPAKPFLLIEDGSLTHDAGTARMRVDLARWRQNNFTRCPRDTLDVNVGFQPLVIYTGSTPFELKDQLPTATIFDSQDHPEELARISWNYLRELTSAEGMHLSMQPFLLRTYARHIARLWQDDYGHRPIVKAETAVSLNFRPLQPVVLPEADLASVKLARLHHNAWIKDLECARIPPGSF